jgi:hypothetical protein
MSRRIINAEKTIVKNQSISLRMNEVTLNLMLKIQGNIKDEFNWLKNIMEKGIKFEIKSSTEEIIREFTIRTSMIHGEIGNDLRKLRKGVGN